MPKIMKKLLMLTLLLTVYGIAKGQTTNKAITEHDPAVRAKDSTIKAGIIEPAEQNAGDQAPDWAALTQAITQKYDATTADRTITKAKIYFYYYKDWPTFCADIVHYTDNYELADDYKLLNLNAGMILKNSDNQNDLKEALKWSKAALGSDPANEKFKTTYDALLAKVSQ